MRQEPQKRQETPTHSEEVVVFEEVRETDGGYIRESREMVLDTQDPICGTGAGTGAQSCSPELNRLYASLCGSVPGQYWPQALLDSAGKFNRPPFPARSPGRKYPQ